MGKRITISECVKFAKIHNGKCLSKQYANSKPRYFNLTMKDGKQRKYYPDIYIFSLRKWVEIKGYFIRSISQEKWEIFHKLKPNSELWGKKKLKSLGIL